MVESLMHVQWLKSENKFLNPQISLESYKVYKYKYTMKATN